jgi:hypothetical protein
MAEPEESGAGRIRGESFSGAALCLEVRDGGIVSLKRPPRPKVTPKRRNPPSRQSRHDPNVPRPTSAVKGYVYVRGTPKLTNGELNSLELILPSARRTS